MTPNAQFQNGEAIVGGTFYGHPWLDDLVSPYREAVRSLAAQCEATKSFQTLVLPLIYNLRHAVELMLKDLAKVSHALLEAKGQQPRVSPNFDTGHNLGRWRTDAKTLLGQVGYQFPQSIDDIVDALAQLNDDDGQRWRYGYHKPPGKKQQVQYSFPDEVTIPVRDLVAKFEKVYSDVFSEDEQNRTLSLHESLGREFEDV